MSRRDDQHRRTRPTQSLEHPMHDRLAVDMNLRFRPAHARAFAAGEDREGDISSCWHEPAYLRYAHATDKDCIMTKLSLAVQLYTLRQEQAKDFAGTIRQVEIGRASCRKECRSRLWSDQ